MKSRPTRKQAREILSIDAQIRAVYMEDRQRRGKARTGHPKVVK